MTYRVGYIIGSISEKSINRRLAEALTTVAPAELELVELPIKQLPFYNHDDDDHFPQVGKEFKDAIERCDAVLFVTPEYNRSIPGVLKNAIDMASRPWGENSFAGKPGAVIGTSPGAMATAFAQNQLRGILSFLDVLAMGQPEGYVNFREGMLNDDNSINNEATSQFLTNYMAAFAAHIRRCLG